MVFEFEFAFEYTLLQNIPCSGIDFGFYKVDIMYNVHKPLTKLKKIGGLCILGLAGSNAACTVFGSDADKQILAQNLKNSTLIVDGP